jgi:hypothetical protein
MTEHTKKLISSAAVAEMLGVSPRTLDRIKAESRAGFPKGIKISGTDYYDPKQIEAFKGRVMFRKRRISPLELLIEA